MVRKSIWGVILTAILMVPGGAQAGGGHGSSADTNFVVFGPHDIHHPLVAFHPRGLNLSVPLWMAARVETVNAFPVDAKGNLLETGAAGNFQIRMGVNFDTGRVLAPFQIAVEYEHDLLTGGVGGHGDLDGEGMPNHHGLEQQIRKAALRASLGAFAHIRGGLMTSSWGLGLVANGGDHSWSPGSAAFLDPRGGDRVARLMLATGPVTPMKLVLAAGHDWVMHDDNTLEGDTARNIFGSFMLGAGLPTNLGFYAVYRSQENEAGAWTRVTALDMYARTQHKLGDEVNLTVEAEAAFIVGNTTLSPSPEFIEKSVMQVGAAVRGTVDAGWVGGVLDFLYASGDANLDDATQSAFKPDPNYEQGIIFYRYVLAGMTGRATATASNKDVIGYAAQDLERFPTRESASNTIAIFPRGFIRPFRGMEVYAGPLVILAPSAPTDPFNTKIAGGQSRNALNGDPSHYLGTEIDMGARFRMLLGGTELTLGLEGGVFLPGEGLNDANDERMDPVYGGRFLLGYRL